jgi:hypothetical protein
MNWEVGEPQWQEGWANIWDAILAMGVASRALMVTVGRLGGVAVALA